MIISDKYKCIFIRIPKTGSTSVETLFKKIDPDCISSDEENIPYGHFYASQLKDMVGEKKWNEYYKFAFVRHPYSWIKSQYTYNMWGTYENYPEVEKKLYLVLDGHEMAKPKDNVFNIDHMVKLYLLLKEWFQGEIQSRYVDLDIDFIGKMENFQEDMNKVFKKLGIPQYSLPHTNRSEDLALHSTGTTGKKYVLDDDAKKFVDIILKEDFKLYNQS